MDTYELAKNTFLFGTPVLAFSYGAISFARKNPLPQARKDLTELERIADSGQTSNYLVSQEIDEIRKRHAPRILFSSRLNIFSKESDKVEYAILRGLILSYAARYRKGLPVSRT